jgi:hypothetical protein
MRESIKASPRAIFTSIFVRHFPQNAAPLFWGPKNHITMTFFSGFTFTVLVAFTHFPLFCLYVVWFKNGLMRFEAAREALVTRGVIKRRSSQQRGKSRIRGNATELERKNNDDIIAEQTEEEEKEEDED